MVDLQSTSGYTKTCIVIDANAEDKVIFTLADQHLNSSIRFDCALNAVKAPEGLYDHHSFPPCTLSISRGKVQEFLRSAQACLNFAI